MTKIEVIDTAVKVGLGALISAGSAFLLNRQKNLNEALKEEKKHQKDTLKEMIKCIEDSETNLNKYTASLHKLEEYGVFGNLDFLLNSEKEAYHARGLSYLLDSIEISSTVSKFAKHVEKIYESATTDRVNYNSLIKEWDKYRNDIYKLL